MQTMDLFFIHKDLEINFPYGTIYMIRKIYLKSKNFLVYAIGRATCATLLPKGVK